MKRILSIFLCLEILLSAVSMNTFATSRNIQTESSDFKYTQKHTVDNWSSQNDKFMQKYMAGASVPFDGRNSNPNMIIPGLSSDECMVPQGMGYDNDMVYITAYHNDGSSDKNPSVLYTLDFATGELKGVYDLYNISGHAMTGHVGGVAVSGNNIYVASGNSIYLFEVSKMSDGKVTATASKQIPGAVSGIDGNIQCSYTSITDNVLYVGNFYNGTDSKYNKPATEKYNSAVYCFNLTGSGDMAEWNDFNSKTHFDNVYYLSNEIENVQCATVKDGRIILSTSYGRKNDSKLYIGDAESVVENYFYVSSMPMMECFFVKDNCIYNIFESAAYYYNGYNKGSVSKNPTDVVWKTELDAVIENHTNSPTFAEILHNIFNNAVNFLKNLINKIINKITSVC